MCADWLIGGKEHLVMVFRVIAFMLVTVEESLDLFSHGGASYDIRYLTKWSIWLTWLYFLTGMFCVDPPPQGDKALLKSMRYGPCRAWKWNMVTF